MEGRAGDLSLRIELISLVSRRPLLPPLSLHAVFFFSFFSVEGEEHFSHSVCMRLFFLADAGDCVSR